MKVSVIVPIYNVEQYIKRCYNTLVNQSYKNIEIISVIDGSTDNSAEIVEEYAQKYSYIKVIKKENGGLSSARNEGIKYATGEYITFVDPDDWIDLNLIERCVEEIELEKADVVVFPYIKEFRNKSVKLSFFDGRTVFDESKSKEKLYRRFFGLYGEELNDPLKVDQLSTACCKLYKKDIIGEVRFLDTKIIGTEDAYFNMLVFGNVKKAVYIEDVYYHYFKENSNSLTVNYKSKLFEQWKTLYKYMNDEINKNNLSEDFKIALNNRICLNQLGLTLNIVNSNLSIKAKLQELKKLLNQDLYKEAYKNFDFSLLDMKWKMFYRNCKSRNYVGVYILCRIAEYMRRKRN